MFFLKARKLDVITSWHEKPSGSQRRPESVLTGICHAGKHPYSVKKRLISTLILGAQNEEYHTICASSKLMYNFRTQAYMSGGTVVDKVSPERIISQ